MTPNCEKIHRAFVILVIALTGCTPAKPPSADLNAAADAVHSAQDAGAGVYAPLELRNAEDHLSAARAAVGKHDYDDALRLARESRVDSELATVKARLGKDREKVQAQIRTNGKLRSDLNLPPAADDAGDRP